MSRWMFSMVMMTSHFQAKPTMVEDSEKNFSSGFGRKTTTIQSKKKSLSNKNDSQQTNNVKTMKKETRFSCTKVDTFPPTGFGKSGSFSGRTKFEELAVGGNTKTRRGIIKPSKEYVRLDDDNYFTHRDQNYQLLLILRVHQYVIAERLPPRWKR